MRLMLVDEDRAFGHALVQHLTGEGYAVDWVPRTAIVSAAVVSEGHECLLLGLDSSGADGATLLRSMDASKVRIPRLVFSSQRTAADRVALLDLGADDILYKPVDLLEVSARIRAATRRSSPHQEAGGSELRHGPLSLDTAQRTGCWRGEPVKLTNKEYRVLEALVRSRHQILSRSRLEERLYAWDDGIGSNAVEVYVHHLRRKLSPRLIVTFRGVGYRLGTPESLVDAVRAPCNGVRPAAAA